MPMTSIITILLLNLIAVFFWLWIMSKISNNDRSTIKMTIYLGVLSTILLLWYDRLNRSGYLWWTMDIRYIYFWWFIIIWLSLSYLLINKKLDLGYISRLILSTWFGFISFIIWGRVRQWARSEEITKFFSANNIYDKNKKVSSDILLFSIISAVWFGFIENLIYLARNISSDKNVLVIWITRFLMIYIMHILFTGIIWYGSYIDAKKQGGFYVMSILGMVLWATIHGVYNYFLWDSNMFIVLSLLWLWYFCIIYLFYKSDRLFVNVSR